MRLLAFVDVHGNHAALSQLLRKAKDADVLVSAGDLSWFGQGFDATLHALAKTKKQVILVHGNHETSAEMRKACSPFENLHFIHKQHLVVDGVLFLGFGGGGFAQREPDFEEVEPLFRESAREHEKVVLVTHAPPYLTRLDRIGHDHCGNRSFIPILKSGLVDLLVCGHFHDNEGEEDRIGNALAVNPGPKGRLLDL
ncbi:MAG: metallophosphoesterase [Nanoarchaeota archaeon]